MSSAGAKISALFCLLLVAGCEPSPQELVLSGPTMGTTYTVKVTAPPLSLDSAQLRATIDDVLAQIDRSMSGYRTDSEVARFNASASTQWYEVSGELAAVVQAALDISEKSGGAFDITVAPLVAAWGFGPAGEPTVLPNAGQLAQLAASIGYRKLHVQLDPPALRKDVAALTIDLNGIAPGFAVDRRRDSRARPQRERRSMAHRHRAAGGYATSAVRRRVARRRVGLDLGRVSRLLRARWASLFAHDRSAYAATIAARTGLGRGNRSFDCVGGCLGHGAQRTRAAGGPGARRAGAHAGVVHRASGKWLASAVDGGIRALSFERIEEKTGSTGCERQSDSLLGSHIPSILFIPSNLPRSLHSVSRRCRRE
jgi:hypothetical protein